ncbi:hypothetical protein FSP39_009952 [Pinctada imbricata]|uniref:Uncharacterized protein n=1 Tax=Pinctada imbricata TaxID=66713 RepID=A0AA88YLC8_PINIB|nr:hypothetical protein FSP39_009952 [Pinctada imbricata]
MPKFHTREMRKKFINACGRMCNVNASYLRVIYRLLSGDNSVSEFEISKNVDERIIAAWEAEDPDIIVDLRSLNEGRPHEYSVFYEKCRIYLENVVEQVVDERRHDKLTYLASAISIPDLLSQVAKTCDKDTPIPSEQWLRYQFAPKNPHAASSSKHTGNLNIKYMVQSRVFRKKHEDDHYCAALFRYLREMAIQLKDNANFIATCMDDKHYCKVGEPGNPLAAVERGRQVLVAGNKILAASDNDFAKMSIIPSVTMKIDIPEIITGSFYRGQVYVGLKDHIFESSSPIPHMAELMKILCPDGQYANVKPILLMYTDGGPDHRVNFMSVKASLICLFRALNLDMLVAVRTAPNASWRNPPERIMSILNLALNCVGLMRKEMDEEFEAKIKSCNTMNDIRAAANKHDGLREAVGDSLESVKILLGDLFGRLSLKDKQFEIFQSASDEEIDFLWNSFVR